MHIKDLLYRKPHNNKFIEKQLIKCLLYQGLPLNSNNKLWVYICSKGFFAGLIFGGAYFRRGLLLEGILRFKMSWV